MTRAKRARRIRFLDELNTQGEIDAYRVQAGDKVKFKSSFDKPGWPRVDAGAVGTVLTVHPDQGVYEVGVMGAEATTDNSVVFGKRRVIVSPDTVDLLVHSADPRIGNYRISQ